MASGQEILAEVAKAQAAAVEDGQFFPFFEIVREMDVEERKEMALTYPLLERIRLHYQNFPELVLHAQGQQAQELMWLSLRGLLG